MRAVSPVNLESYSETTTRRERLLLQIEWLRKLMTASNRYDVPRMKILCESMCEPPLIELSNPKYCLNMLADLKKNNCVNLFETCIGIVSSHVHRVIDTPTFVLLSETRPDIIEDIMNRVKDRDSVRRWDAHRQHVAVNQLDTLLKRKEDQDLNNDNSFMRNTPFPYRVISFGIGIVVVYYLAITRLPPAQKGWIPLLNILVVTIGFIFVARGLSAG